MTKNWLRLTTALVAGTLVLSAVNANAVDLRQAVQTAVSTNPEISQASENREAVEFELRQARGALSSKHRP